MCRTGRWCTFAHGYDELRSWKESVKKDQKNAPVAKEEKSTCQTEEKIEICRNEVLNLVRRTLKSTMWKIHFLTRQVCVFNYNYRSSFSTNS